jgi:hypothetical protein
MVDSVATKKNGDFDELIFKRELNEVYLPLDFISGRQDAHIWNLDVDIPVKGDTNKKQTAFDLYQLISTMRYPPPGSNDTGDKAYDSTVLLYVKDRLKHCGSRSRDDHCIHLPLSRRRASCDGRPGERERAQRFNSTAKSEVLPNSNSGRAGLTDVVTRVP